MTKALSIQQPWAWLIVNGWKPIENRDWPTNVRGRIAIHTGKKFDDAGYTWVQKHFPEIDMPKPDAFERGGIVGHAELRDCVAQHDSPWFQGRYGFVFSQPSTCALQPCRGMLGFFTPNAPAPSTAPGGRG